MSRKEIHVQMDDDDGLHELSELLSTTKEYDQGTPTNGEEVCESIKVEERMKEQENHRMWSSVGNDVFVGCNEAHKTLPLGQYVAGITGNGTTFLEKQKMTFDTLLELPDTASKEVLDAIELFWTKEQHFRKHGFLWKRGILLWGPPGSGKTSTLQLIARGVHTIGGISLMANSPNYTSAGLKLIRQIEPATPIVVMFEDMDALVQECGESRWLAILDGELQIDNVIFVATTNYPERLDARFINRPSRFDIVKKIGMPSADARRMYLSLKNPRLVEENNKSELETWVTMTKGFSIAHLKEVITSVECFEIPFDAVIKRLRTMMDIKISSSETKGNFGFLSGDDKESD